MDTRQPSVPHLSHLYLSRLRLNDKVADRVCTLHRGRRVPPAGSAQEGPAHSNRNLVL